MRLPRRLHTAQPLDPRWRNDPDVALGESKLDMHGLRRSLVVEGHHEHRALALGQALEALAKATRIERLEAVIDERGQVGRERLEEPLASQATAPPVDHHLPAGAEDERGEPLRLADFAGADFCRIMSSTSWTRSAAAASLAGAASHRGIGCGAQTSGRLRLRGVVPVRCGRSNAPRELSVVARERWRVSHGFGIRPRVGDQKCRHAEEV